MRNAAAVFIHQRTGVETINLKGAASGCISLAKLWAKTLPEPGVALNPPVPQPQLKYRFSTGVFDRIGQRRGRCRCRPADDSCARLKIGSSSTIACKVCSIVGYEPRWP